MLDLVCQGAFLADVVGNGQFGLLGSVRLQGVGKIELEAFIFAQFIAMFRQQVADLEVSHGVGRHHQFNGVEVGQDVVFDQLMDTTAAIIAFVLFYGHFDSFRWKGEGAGCGIENGDIL
ncbi:MAG: hypothetical protein BWX83_00066 [Candidatus Cloacimonetes bacterium ADurb.Bin117]|nr:MAG: hypothetical protein BWX83_00066 [Candidatus Cloacimonetes bacterium ADurb.Bin117]